MPAVNIAGWIWLSHRGQWRAPPEEDFVRAIFWLRIAVEGDDARACPGIIYQFVICLRGQRGCVVSRMEGPRFVMAYRMMMSLSGAFDESAG